MATSPVVSTPASSSAPSSGSMFDMIGSALSDTSSSEPSQAETTSSETETAPTETQSTETPTEASATSEPVQDADATASAETQTPETEANPYEQEDGEVPQLTLDTILKTPRGQEIYRGYKALKEISKPIEQGGIGHVPSVEQIRDYYGAFRDQSLIESDLNSGNQQQAERVIAHLFNPQRGIGPQAVAAQLIPSLAKTNPQALAQIVPNLASTLASANPEAYSMAAVPFLENYSTRLWDRWAELPGGEANSPQQRLKDAMGYAAQVLQKDLTGKYRDANEGVQPQGNQPDPLAEERQALAYERQQMQQARQQQFAHGQQQWEGALVQGINRNFTGELDKALGKLKTAYEKAPMVYEATRKKFHDDVVKEVPNVDPHAWAIFRTRYNEARQSRRPDLIEALSKEYVRMAQPVIKAKLKPFYEQAGIALQAQSDAKHAALRSIDSQKPVNQNGGAGPTPTTQTAPKIIPGERAEDRNRRLIAEAFR